MISIWDFGISELVSRRITPMNANKIGFKHTFGLICVYLRESAAD